MLGADAHEHTAASGPAMHLLLVQHQNRLGGVRRQSMDRQDYHESLIQLEEHDVACSLQPESDSACHVPAFPYISYKQGCRANTLLQAVKCDAATVGRKARHHSHTNAGEHDQESAANASRSHGRCQCRAGRHRLRHALWGDCRWQLSCPGSPQSPVDDGLDCQACHFALTQRLAHQWLALLHCADMRRAS